jgi:soluble lytic murein transglycosylase
MKQVHKIVLVTILLIISTDISYSKLISPREKPLQFQTLENNEKIIEKKNIKEKKIVNDAKQISTNVNEEQKKIEKNTAIEELKYKDSKPIQNVDKISNNEKSEVVEEIIPPLKPLLLNKSNDKQFSSVLNEKDFEIAKKTFSYIKNRSWKSAFDTAKRSSDKLLLKTAKWIYLKEPSNSASFYDYVEFIENNKDWPRINRLRYLAEHRIDYKNVSPNDVINFFAKTSPTSGFGTLKLGEAYLIKGDITKGTPLIKQGFKNASLDQNDLKYISSKFKNILGSEDFIERANFMAWEQEYWELNRTIPYLPKDYKELYHARFSLMTRSYGVDSAISKVPAKFIDDVGLQFDRMKWRRKRGRFDSALEIIEKFSAKPDLLVKPELWMKEKFIIARKNIDDKKYKEAYELFINHGITDKEDLVDAEWHAGWLALTFLNKPNEAVSHFKTMYESVSYPISKSRGAFWIGKSFEKINNKIEAENWYTIASNYNTTFYGQLAALKINKKNIQVKNDYLINEENYKKFLRSELARSIILLAELDQTSLAKDLIKHYDDKSSSPELRIFLGTLSQTINRLDYAIQIAKEASYEGVNLLELNYPVIETPGIVSDTKILDQSYILALIRQESEFDASANSHVGARGLMQIMPATGKLLGKKTGLSYSPEKLTEDEFFNLQLGSYYLTDLYKNFDNNIYLALAAYNAGPQRVNKWIAKFGDPRKKEIDTINFIEHIPFSETRNYVQRVIENINVYKFILSKKSVENNIDKLLYN